MEFPRTILLPTGSFTVYEPQIENHAGFTEATAWSAAAYRPKGGQTAFGAIKYKAKISIDKRHRLVTIFDREVLQVQFSELDEAQAAELSAQLRANVRNQPETIPLDVMLGYVADRAADDVSVEVSFDPPTIHYASEPTMLVVLDGEPIKVAVEGADGLSIIVNTNWNLFYSEKTESYSLFLGSSWMSAPSLDSSWTVAEAPAGISALPEEERWAPVKNAVPGEPLAEKDAPDILVAPAPAELIVTKGPVELEPIPGTELSFVSNTASDIVFNGADGFYYFLTSGRWFKADSLEGKWEGVMTAPTVFQQLPTDHARAHLRASVAGTPEAKLAVTQAQIPQTAQVSRETQAPEVRYAGDEPKFEKIKGTQVFRATNTTYDVLRVGEDYFLCHDAVWFASKNPKGPWSVTDTIPVEIYNIPADSPSHRLTYVKVYQANPDTVYVGYTSGYHYNYISGGVVVYGSGYYWGTYYDPYYYTYYPSYYYYPYPRTYGSASIYQANTGTYVHGHYAYGPYGGYWEGARYNPNTGRYGSGTYAYTYDASAYQGWSYNPRTGISTETSQAIQWSDGNSYETWGETVVQGNGNTVQAERYGTEQGFRRSVESSAGGQATQVGNADNRMTVGKTSDGELYAGANGNVYRRTEDGTWETRSNGEWNSVDSQAARSNAQTRANESGFNRESFDQGERFDRSRGAYSDGFDYSQLERDRSARMNGRSQYDSFRSSMGGGGFSGVRPSFRR
jgi:hypothetical protein